MSDYSLKELKIEVTCECPLICIHCSSDSSPSSRQKVSLKKCLSIISEASEMGVQKIAFSGGEPLLYQGIVDITKAASQQGMYVSIYSTGNVDNFSEILEKLKTAGLDSLVFSLYANTIKDHELITRIAGSFNRTIDALRKTFEIGIEPEIHFVALKRNYKYLPDVVAMARSLNVCKVSVLRFVPQGRGYLIDDQILDKNDFLELKRIILQLRGKFNIRTGSPLNFLFVNEQPVCNAGQDRLLIDTELNISPCDAFKQIRANEIVGTLELSNLSNKTLQECWLNSPYLNSIRGFLESGYSEICSACGDLSKCKSGCIAQKVIRTGRLTKMQDPSCINE
jgi:radical SAM protein with 4Fe4S-binding SPASM domain